MTLPVSIPNTFANATTSIPLANLDANFTTIYAAVNGIGNGSETLANVQVSGGTLSNVTLDNVTVDVETLSNVTLVDATVTSGNATFTTANATTIDTTDIEVTNIKAKDGTAAATIADSTGKITVSTELAVDNLNLSVNTISSTDTNGNIVLAPNGSGDVQVDADTLRVGDSGSDATVQSNGNADLILKTGNATTGSVTLADGADGNLTVALNGTGQIIVNAGAVGTPTIAPTGDTNTGIYFPAADNIGFATNGVIRGRWTTDGLCFGSDTAAANALDDYEEGTFTPTAFGQTTAGTTTYDIQQGAYTKIGRQVTVSIRLNYSALTGTGDLSFGGLPFTSITGGMEFMGSMMANDLNWGGGTMLSLYMPSNATYMIIFYQADNAGWSTQQCVNESAGFRFTMTYFTA